MKRKLLILLALILGISVLAASCTTGVLDTDVISTPSATWESDKDDEPQDNTISYTDESLFEPSYDYDEEEYSEAIEGEATGSAVLNGSSIEFTGNGAEVSGSVITIFQSGTYTFTGSLDDGRIVVNLIDDGDAYLVFSGVSITASDGPAVYIVNSGDTVITLTEGTENYLADGSEYSVVLAADDEPNAVLYSKDDLIVNGSGSLEIDANYKHGINGKDDLMIEGADITITAVSDGIRGKDSVVILSGNIKIDAGSDGIQSSNDEDAEKGFIVIEGGTIDIVCENDGIQAATELLVLGGEINITAGGGTQNIVVAEDRNEQDYDSMMDIEETESSKGLKAGVLIALSGGSVNIDSHDDALHSDNLLEISGGTLILSTDDDGIHADEEILINGGDISIENCEEGIEAAIITINDGEIFINAFDDGLNASDGSGGAGMMGGPGFETATAGVELNINGGYIIVRSNGDGVDSNGNFTMTGGTVIVHGPQSSTNGALDANGEIEVDGGTLAAVGASGMSEYPDGGSQNSFIYVYDTVQPGGTTITIKDSKGNELLELETVKEYQTIVFSSDALINGETYTISSDGSAVTQITLSGTVTVVGVQSRINGPGGNTGGQPGKRP